MVLTVVILWCVIWIQQTASGYIAVCSCATHGVTDCNEDKTCDNQYTECVTETVLHPDDHMRDRELECCYPLIEDSVPYSQQEDNHWFDQYGYDFHGVSFVIVIGLLLLILLSVVSVALFLRKIDYKLTHKFDVVDDLELEAKDLIDTP
eukprot:179705_1